MRTDSWIIFVLWFNNSNVRTNVGSNNILSILRVWLEGGGLTYSIHSKYSGLSWSNCHSVDLALFIVYDCSVPYLSWFAHPCCSQINTIELKGTQDCQTLRRKEITRPSCAWAWYWQYNEQWWMVMMKELIDNFINRVKMLEMFKVFIQSNCVCSRLVY